MATGAERSGGRADMISGLPRSTASSAGRVVADNPSTQSVLMPKKKRVRRQLTDEELLREITHPVLPKHLAVIALLVVVLGLGVALIVRGMS